MDREGRGGRGFENGARVDEGDVVGFANWIPVSDDLLGVVEE